jgi:D-3-phosphoglycerate dehydrogenase / 2-oxoglutarate reductase
MVQQRARVLVTEAIHPIGVEVLAREVEVVNLPERPGETVAQHLPIVDGVLVRTARLTAPLLETAPGLKIIGKHGVGIDNIDVVAARRLGIPIVSTPGANAEAVAEHALTLMLMVARQIQVTSRLLKNGQFDAARSLPLATDLSGKTLGLVGLGNVGTRLAAMCRSALAMRVLAYDPYVRPERAAELGVELVSELGPLFDAADVVSIHVPLTPETRGIVGVKELARLKPSAILVNCARGGLVDEAALLAALRTGQLAGAGLDVFEEEPVPPDHPFLTLVNVVATPHVAGGSREALQLMAETVALDILRVLRGEPPVYPYHGSA